MKKQQQQISNNYYNRINLQQYRLDFQMNYDKAGSI